ncbi:MAG: cyclase family protein, partial [Anaerolineales bacterium]
GWGWSWGKEDEVGALNGLTDDIRLAALREVSSGKMYDLGVAYDRRSYKWPGHSPGEIMTFRSPEGVERQGDVSEANPAGSYWHSCALFLSDNIGTQIDGLGHVTTGPDHHWYNGFKEAQAGGDFGIRRCDAASIPPIVARGVLIDVAGHKGVDALPSRAVIGAADLQAALAWEKADIEPGDVVLIRTGTLRHWGEAGADHEAIVRHDSAGIDLDAARWLVRDKGAVLVGSDTSGLEITPAPAGGFIPVHVYLLIEEGVHIGEFHHLEELARDRVYRFTYIASVNKIRGAVAGFALRPIAIPRGGQR